MNTFTRNPPPTPATTPGPATKNTGVQRLQPTQTLFKIQEVRVPGPQEDPHGSTQRYLEVSTVLTALKNLSREAWTAGVNSAGWWQARVTSRQWLRSWGRGGVRRRRGPPSVGTPRDGPPSRWQGPATAPPRTSPSACSP